MKAGSPARVFCGIIVPLRDELIPKDRPGTPVTKEPGNEDFGDGSRQVQERGLYL